MSLEIPKILSRLDKITHPYTRDNPLDRKELPTIGSINQITLPDFIEFVENKEFIKLIDQGNITLAAIKPQAQKSKLGKTNDLAAAKLMADAINLDPILSPVFSISIKLEREETEEFYPNTLKTMLFEQKSIHHNDKNGWDDFMDFLTSGPISYFILWDSTQEKRAITRWREIMGTTDPKVAGPGTIRGNYAKSIQANLVHGSSSPDEVKREINWLKKVILSRVQNN